FIHPFAGAVRVLVAVDADHARLGGEQSVGATGRRSLRQQNLVTPPVDERSGQDSGAHGSEEPAAGGHRAQSHTKGCANVMRVPSGSRTRNSRSPQGWLTGAPCTLAPLAVSSAWRMSASWTYT